MWPSIKDGGKRNLREADTLGEWGFHYKGKGEEGSKLPIAAACFSIYAFKELKKQLISIEE